MRTSRQLLLPISLGSADGILNALTLAASSFIGGARHATVGLAWRISVAALVTAGFAVFVADYSEARGNLRHASRELSMPTETGLLDTELGRTALHKAARNCALASGASLVGALAPLLLAAILPGPGWIAAAIAVLALGALGVALARAVLANPVRWAVTLMLGGIAVTAIGAWLKIA